MTHAIKQAIKWKPQPLPYLIDKRSDKSPVRIYGLRSALHGIGNYRLCHAGRQFSVHPDQWPTFSEATKQDKFKTFVCSQPPTI